MAHLFIRDPLTLFEEKIHLDDANESDHFEVSAEMHFTPLTRGETVFWTHEELVTTEASDDFYFVFL